MEELSLITEVLCTFGEASGLHINLGKSSVVPIHCDEAGMEAVQSNHACQISSFPCKYLGLPVSVRRITKHDLQPILDKIGDYLPGWKASLLQKSGMVILMKAVLRAIPIYLLIALDVPTSFVKAVDKWRRGFL